MGVGVGGDLGVGVAVDMGVGGSRSGCDCGCRYGRGCCRSGCGNFGTWDRVKGD